MCGVYFHIPFCRKKCYYCDFFSVSNSSSNFSNLVNSEIRELIIRKNYLESKVVNTIYFGGGTPTVLDIKYLRNLLETVYSNFEVSDECEISIEANPDDLNDIYLKDLFKLGFNRLSIGVQSFNNDVLKFLGRKHSSEIIPDIIYSAKKEGFNNISLDLIFGIPGFDDEVLISSLESAIELNIKHISAYGLSIANETLFNRKLKCNQFNEIDEEDYIRQFLIILDFLKANGFVQYEISNFAKDGFVSKHNISYWNNTPYLGIGPSAHSYNGVSRQWNVNNLFRYFKLLNDSKVFFSVENLTDVDKYNEYILTRIRTSGGVSIEFIFEKFSLTIYQHFRLYSEKLTSEGYVEKIQKSYLLSRKGMILCDFVIQQLYFS